MRRRILMISKAPEFDDRDEVVLGQCEPFTSGWDLSLLTPDGKKELLLSGTYSDLHKILESCSKIEEPDAVRRRVKEMRTIQNTSVTETVAVELGRFDPASAQTAVMEPTQTHELPALDERAEVISLRGDNFFEIKEETNVVVAMITSPERASEVAELKKQLLKLLEQKPRAIILDLNRVGNLASRAANEMAVFSDQCAEAEVAFGLCNLRQNVRKLFDTLKHKNPPTLYADSDEARAEILAKN